MLTEGDSITAGNHTVGVAYPQDIAQQAPGLFYSVVDTATGGSTLATLTARQASDNAQIPANPRHGVFTSMIGINDWANGTSPADFLTAYAVYLDQQKVAGWRKVAIYTILPDTGDPPVGGVSAISWARTVNATLRTWVGLHCDAVIDVGVDSGTVMGADSAPDDPTLYLPDRVHPTLLGQSLLANTAITTLGSLTN